MHNNNLINGLDISKMQLTEASSWIITYWKLLKNILQIIN